MYLWIERLKNHDAKGELACSKQILMSSLDFVLWRTLINFQALKIIRHNVVVGRLLF